MTAAADVPDVRVPGYLGRVLDEDRDPVGTCFQVAPGVLVTAWHVLDAIGAAADDARVRIDPLAGGEAFDAAVARMDAPRDLAVLTSAACLLTVTGPLAATDQMPLRVTVTVTGHAVPDDPGHTYRFLNAPGEWAGGTLRDETVPLGRMISSAVVPGMSGAPVICDSDGAVAGVVSGRYNSGDGWMAGTVWVARTEDLAVLLDGIAKVTMRQAAARALPGWPLTEVRDPFALEVHQPVRPENPQPGLPVLPAYVPREHDAELGSVVRAATDGSSGIAVLVGGSSTGKTRACWEAVQRLRDRPEPWRLWHPIDPSRPDAALREMPVIGPRTVVWLNEAQLYLNTTDAGLGERVAAGLRELLRDAARAPVLVLATLWPEYWDVLTAGPAASGNDPHAQARELLDGHDITVPAAFTAAQMQRLSQAGDARLARAADGAQDGQVIQFLAGVPELLSRYRNAPPAAKALIHAAMDARRLGTGIALPRAFLAGAVPPPGYLTDTEWDAQDDDWLEQALDYTTKDAKGVRGPLTRIRPRPARSSTRDSEEQLADDQASTPGGPLYRLADYLDQHGRHDRKGEIPPVGFWDAAANYAVPADQAALGDAAHARGLYRDAAQLHKNAAARGNFRAVRYLTDTAHYLRGDVRPLSWDVDHIPLGDPGAVGYLLDRLREAGAQEQAAALLTRDPAAHAFLDDPSRVVRLLESLRRADAQEQVAALLARDPAAHVSLDNPFGVSELLDKLREAGAHKQVAALADRAAAHSALDNRNAVGYLLDSLREAGAHKQVAALLARDPAAHVSLDDPSGVTGLMDNLREAGAHKQAAALADRAAAQTPLDDPFDVGGLLDSLREAGAHKQVAALLARDPAAHVSLDNPIAVAQLLDSLWWPGAHKQATALAARAAAQAPLDNPDHVSRLLDSLREAGAHKQVAALLARDPAAHVSLGDPFAVGYLLDSLREAGAQEQATALASRAAAQTPLDDPGRVAVGLLGKLREAGAQEQATALASRAAAQTPLHDPGAVADLLDGLQRAGAQEQATALASRAAAQAPLHDPGAMARLLNLLRRAGTEEQTAALLRRDPAAHVSLGDPGGVGGLLNSLRGAGAADQVAALLARDPATHVSLGDPFGVGGLLDSLRGAGAADQVAALLARDPAAHVSLDDPGAPGSGYLLDRLRKAGAQEQAIALADRLPGAGEFELFRRLEDHQNRFRFGREADGSPARPWDWDDLD